jgi:hypothetical protein
MSINGNDKEILDESLVQFYIERDLPLKKIKKTLVKLCLVRLGIRDIYVSNSSKFNVSHITACNELCNYIGLNMDIIDISGNGIIKWIGYRNITSKILEYLKMPYYTTLVQAELQGFKHPMTTKELFECYQKDIQYRLYINLNPRSEWATIIKDVVFRFYKDNRINTEEILNTDIYDEIITTEVLQCHITYKNMQDLSEYYGNMFRVKYTNT